MFMRLGCPIFQLNAFKVEVRQARVTKQQTFRLKLEFSFSINLVVEALSFYLVGKMRLKYAIEAYWSLPTLDN